MVTGDITHCVVAAVGALAFHNNIGNLLHRMVGFAEYVDSRVIYIEIKLGIEHTRFNVRRYELWVAVCLANHPKCTVGILALHLVGEHAPIVERNMFASIVAVAVEIVVVDPIEGGISHGVAHLIALEVEGGDMYVEPSREAGFIPEFEIPTAIGEDRVSNPIRMLLQGRTLDMHVVSYIIEDYVHVMCMSGREHFSKRSIVAEAVVNLRVEDGPITMVTGEFGIGIEPMSPRRCGVLRDR